MYVSVSLCVRAQESMILVGFKCGLLCCFFFVCVNKKENFVEVCVCVVSALHVKRLISLFSVQRQTGPHSV